MSLPPTSVLIQVAIGGLLTGGVYALLVSGLTLIFGVMRVINIAHGAFLVLSAYLAYWLFTLLGMDPIVSIAVLAPLFFVFGVLVQRYLIARVRQGPGPTVLGALRPGNQARGGDGLPVAHHRPLGAHRLHGRGRAAGTR